MAVASLPDQGLDFGADTLLKVSFRRFHCRREGRTFARSTCSNPSTNRIAPSIAGRFGARCTTEACSAIVL